MPLLILLLVPILALLLMLVLMPVGLVQRYRANSSPRVARPWLLGCNIVVLVFSVLLFLTSATITTFWIPKALPYTLAGLVGGGLLGLLGLVLTRWDGETGRLRYTPNRFLALGITLLVAGRLGYSVWRVAQGWGGGPDQRAWIVDSGVPGSMGVGAIVLGYALAYWIGVHRRARPFRSS